MGGMREAMGRIEALAKRGLFRSRDLVGISRNWLQIARDWGRLTAHGSGIWSAPQYRPTAYELAQLRFPRAVFWGPSALWLLGESQREPEVLWLALGNNARLPRTLEPATVIIRTRRLEQDAIALRPPGRLLTLRVYSRARAQADVARYDCERRAIQADVHLSVPRHADLLTTDCPYTPGRLLPASPTGAPVPRLRPGPCRGS